ncbi:SSI family serine proteinase inhibitor [Actinokineospora diospyrosa]|uniref:Subtilisin inhibitor-like n=1 Tax=Actinokineospora diospyrosa TaxID=103728 RepID=A0ABT1IF07_9PSEU|nr:SSI family serine proteinase inhibitor [Actinokineospora diospyrosa]MCP2270901.1 Subtilisin inhibitor-like [Actinokineospora diospyrosa]
MRTVLAGLALAALALSGGTAAATAASPDEPRAAVADPGASLTLTTQWLSNGQTKAAILNCDPTDGSTHADPKAACDALKAVNADFDALSDTDRPCTYNYDPVVVTAKGDWYGDYVYFSREYSNQCVAIVSSNDVFGF